MADVCECGSGKYAYLCDDCTECDKKDQRGGWVCSKCISSKNDEINDLKLRIEELERRNYRLGKLVFAPLPE